MKNRFGAGSRKRAAEGLWLPGVPKTRLGKLGADKKVLILPASTTSLLPRPK